MQSLEKIVNDNIVLLFKIKLTSKYKPIALKNYNFNSNVLLANGRVGFQIWKLQVNTLNKQS